MSAPAASVTTEKVKTEALSSTRARTWRRALLAATLVVLVLAGFGFRVYRLDAEGLSEDELNKLRAVEDYRAHGLTPTNGEHPFLMKALLTASIVVAEHWNDASFAQAAPRLRLSTETALRLPPALFGAFTSLLIFLLTAELFGTATGLLAAALWALDPAAIGFNRIAKEDTFLLFFFLLAHIFWLRGQHAAEAGKRFLPYSWATAIAYGAMMASKYMPHLLALTNGYYHIFQALPANRWQMGRRRWLLFFAIMGATFLVLNPTILLPGTWHEIRVFAGEHRIGHDSYEFMGRLYTNQGSLWLKGSPWYFYYAFMAFKLPLPMLASFLIGLPLLARKRLGDGRYFIIFWLFFWFFPFSLLGGKFTRYFTLALPVVLIVAALGVNACAQWLSQSLRRATNHTIDRFARVAISLTVLGGSAYASLGAAPHYRLYTNALGGGSAAAGTYFPHDEFYDASLRETAAAISAFAPPHARVANETPELFTYYAQRAGRDDLESISLSDRTALNTLSAGDIIIVARGRRYFSNDALVAKLDALGQPVAELKLGEVPATRVYTLDERMLHALSSLLKP